MASHVGYQQVQRLLSSALGDRGKRKLLFASATKGKAQLLDTLLCDSDYIPYSENQIGQRYKIANLISDPSPEEVHNYMYDMGVATLTPDGEGLRVPNNFTYILILDGLEKLAAERETDGGVVVASQRLYKSAKGGAEELDRLLTLFKRFSKLGLPGGVLADLIGGE